MNFDLIVIGGGVLGAFHAYHALAKGLRVALFEKNDFPVGASVRNFGQVVPSGMVLKWQNYGRRSLEIYKSIQSETDIGIVQNGSIYISSNEEELKLIEELSEINRKNNYESLLLSKEDCLKRFPSVRADYCNGGLFFPEEVSANPQVMIHRIHSYLKRNANYSYYPGTFIKEVTSNGGRCQAIDDSGKE
jgi:glycine/D-amino acid oxidase-like deaminating enzyme